MRIDSRTGNPYSVSGHFLWVGERTCDLDSAHVQFASLIHNPIGVKLGPTATPEDAWNWQALNPERIPGRLTFITRMGAGKIAETLPPIVERKWKPTATRSSGSATRCTEHPQETSGGVKTRQFEDVTAEVHGFFEVHRTLGTHPGGCTSS